MPAVPFCGSLRRYGNSWHAGVFPYRRKPTALRPYGNSQRTGVFPYRRKSPYLRQYEDSAIEIAHASERICLNASGFRRFRRTRPCIPAVPGKGRRHRPPSSATARLHPGATQSTARRRSCTIPSCRTAISIQNHRHRRCRDPAIAGMCHLLDGPIAYVGKSPYGTCSGWSRHPHPANMPRNRRTNPAAAATICRNR